DAHPAALGGEQRHPDRGLLEDELEALLGVAAGFLGVLARGDVARDDDAADGAPVGAAQRADLDLVAAGVVGGPDLQRARLAVERGAVERLVGLPAPADEEPDGGTALEILGAQPLGVERVAAGDDVAQVAVEDERGGRRQGAQHRERDLARAETVEELALGRGHIALSAPVWSSLTTAR